MRGYFDDEEPDGKKPEERGRDTEFTLTTAAQLGIVFFLLLLCGLCFGLGYWVGHGHSAAALATAANQPAAPTAAPDQEPLQGNGTLPKPSAEAQVPPSPPDEVDTPPAPASDTSPAPAQPQPTPAATPPTHAPTSSPAPVPAAPASPAPAPARPSTPVQPANPSAASGYMVQIAAVLHAEDANVLVNALRNRGFAATAQRSPADGLIHVRIGPFATHEEASRMSARLLGDGYNAMVQP